MRNLIFQHFSYFFHRKKEFAQKKDSAQTKRFLHDHHVFPKSYPGGFTACAQSATCTVPECRSKKKLSTTIGLHVLLICSAQFLLDTLFFVHAWVRTWLGVWHISYQFISTEFFNAIQGFFAMHDIYLS